MGKKHTVSNAIAALLFFTSAVLQFNDPDPVMWTLLYGVAGLMCVLAVRRRGSAVGFVFVGAFAFAWGLRTTLAIEGPVGMGELFAWEMARPSVELAREAVGLILVTVWMWRNAVVYFRAESAATDTVSPGIVDATAILPKVVSVGTDSAPPRAEAETALPTAPGPAH